MAVPGERDADEMDLLTVGQTAMLLRVSKMTVYRMIHAGKLPALQISRSFRINRHDLDDYLWNARLG